jgi:hypothetical protein
MCFFPIRHQQPSGVFKPAFAFLDRELAFPEKQQIQCSFQYTALIVDALTTYVPSVTNRESDHLQACTWQQKIHAESFRFREHKAVHATMHVPEGEVG